MIGSRKLIDVRSIYRDAGAAPDRLIPLAMFIVWLGIVSFLAWTHLVWRDEVRALSLSLRGDTVFAMLKGVHGEGHPALWYLVLRASHALIGCPQVLLLTSIVVAAAAILILVLRAPFSLPFLALILLAGFSIYEYSVMARNYGISMLLLFMFAVLYQRHHDRGLVLGALLILLANCSVPSSLLAGGLLLFWLVDILSGEPNNRAQNIQTFLYNAALAVVGFVICFITIFPTYNDSVMVDSHDITLRALTKAILLPSLHFMASFPGTERLSSKIPSFSRPLAILESIILFGSTFGLIRRAGTFLAALTTLVGFSLFFAIVYPGGYRHQALWLVFMICMYWLARPRSGSTKTIIGDRLQPLASWLSAAGTLLFVVVVLLQGGYTAKKVIGVVKSPANALEDRKNNVTSILAGHPDLEQSVVIADPDYLVETLPYYVSNRTYLMREQRYGNIVHFTRRARLELTLGDVLTDGRRLRQETGRPVLILLSHEIDPSLPDQVYHEGYNWRFVTTPEQARAFRLSTHFLKRLLAPGDTDEGYYAYILDK